MKLHYPDGIVGFIGYLNRQYDVVHEVLFARKVVEVKQPGQGMSYKLEIDVAFQYIEQPNSMILTFVNTIETNNGSSHERAFTETVVNWISDHVRPHMNEPSLRRYIQHQDWFVGLTAVVHVTHPDPQFESVIRIKLLNPDVFGAVKETTTELLEATLENDKQTLSLIVSRVLKTQSEHNARRCIII